MSTQRARITVFDTTLRDGEQSPGCSMHHQEKLRMAHQLDRLGVDVIEAGFPICSDGDFEAVRAIAAVIRRPVKGIEKVTISAHCHNDLGMGVANALTAILAGARQVECTINGIGERAGNAALEEIVMAMRVRPDRYPYDTGVVSEQIFAASQLLSEITTVPVQPNKAITGRNAFAHEAGIHQDGVLKNPLTYEIMTPKSVGVPDSKLVLGKHSGRHALGMRCEQLGYQFDRRALDDIYRRFVRLADKIKHVEDHHLLELIRKTFEQM